MVYFLYTPLANEIHVVGLSAQGTAHHFLPIYSHIKSYWLLYGGHLRASSKCCYHANYVMVVVRCVADRFYSPICIPLVHDCECCNCRLVRFAITWRRCRGLCLHSLYIIHTCSVTHFTLLK